MELIYTPIEGLLVLQAMPCQDARGGFLKPFQAEFFRERGLATDFKEFYYSVNRKGVIRGMHFQTPPCDHEKLVYVSCPAGTVIEEDAFDDGVEVVRR